MEKDIYIRFDWAMKRMLRDKANFGVLEGLLTVLLNDEIKIIELLESEGNQRDSNDKFNRVDIKVRNSKDEIILVEIQNSRQHYFMERLLYGVSKAIAEHITLGDGYDKVKKVISIGIVYFDLGKGTDYLYHGETTFHGVHTNDELLISEKYRDCVVTKQPQSMYPEYYVIRVNEFNKVAKTPLEQWVSYLKTGVIQDSDSAPGLPEARKRLNYYNMSKGEQYDYQHYVDELIIDRDSREWDKAESKEEGIKIGRAEGLEIGRAEGMEEGLELGRAEGHAKGRDEGKLEERIMIAKNLKKAGLPFKLIAENTGLTEEQIAEL